MEFTHLNLEAGLTDVLLTVSCSATRRSCNWTPRPRNYIGWFSAQRAINCCLLPLLYTQRSYMPITIFIFVKGRNCPLQSRCISKTDRIQQELHFGPQIYGLWWGSQWHCLPFCDCLPSVRVPALPYQPAQAQGLWTPSRRTEVCKLNPCKIH